MCACVSFSSTPSGFWLRYLTWAAATPTAEADIAAPFPSSSSSSTSAIATACCWLGSLNSCYSPANEVSVQYLDGRAVVFVRRQGGTSRGTAHATTTIAFAVANGCALASEAAERFRGKSSCTPLPIGDGDQSLVTAGRIPRRIGFRTSVRRCPLLHKTGHNPNFFFYV